MSEPFNCVICGKEENEFLHLKELVEAKLCFECDFWWSKVGRVVEKEEKVNRFFQIDGICYLASTAEGGFRGFGGHKFTVRFADGKVITTTNLWCQGDIPSRFRDMFPHATKI